MRVEWGGHYYSASISSEGGKEIHVGTKEQRSRVDGDDGVVVQPAVSTSIAIGMEGGRERTAVLCLAATRGR